MHVQHTLIIGAAALAVASASTPTGVALNRNGLAKPVMLADQDGTAVQSPEQQEQQQENQNQNQNQNQNGNGHA